MLHKDLNHGNIIGIYLRCNSESEHTIWQYDNFKNDLHLLLILSHASNNVGHKFQHHYQSKLALEQVVWSNDYVRMLALEGGCVL